MLRTIDELLPEHLHCIRILAIDPATSEKLFEVSFVTRTPSQRIGDRRFIIYVVCAFLNLNFNHDNFSFIIV
jgi:hypothetical protein